MVSPSPPARRGCGIHTKCAAAPNGGDSGFGSASHLRDGVLLRGLTPHPLELVPAARRPHASSGETAQRRRRRRRCCGSGHPVGEGALPRPLPLCRGGRIRGVNAPLGQGNGSPSVLPTLQQSLGSPARDDQCVRQAAGPGGSSALTTAHILLSTHTSLLPRWCEWGGPIPAAVELHGQ